MNNSNLDFGSQRGVLAFFATSAGDGVRVGEPAIFRTPEMSLMEDVTEFLRVWYVESGRRSSQLTWANAARALVSWIQFLDEIEIDDWKDASRDDLLEYRETYLSGISPQTGHTYATGTVAGRMATICALYAFAGRRGWYRGDIFDDGHDLPDPMGTNGLSAPAPSRSSRRWANASEDLIPRARRSRTSIKPFTVAELIDFCDAMGPRASDRGEDLRPARNRLIADIGWTTGLRLHEIAQLTKYQFLSLSPAPATLVGVEHQLIVLGKGKKRRSIAVPNWVVIDALAYIDGERAEAVAAVKSRREPGQLILAGLSSRKPGGPLGQRRFQQIVEKACLVAGLTELSEVKDTSTGESHTRRKAKHCVHDLRHTYAVLTYWAEKRHGNPEPWKKIQAQLGHEHLKTTVDTYLHFVEIFGQSEGVDLRQVLELDK